MPLSYARITLVCDLLDGFRSCLGMCALGTPRMSAYLSSSSSPSCRCLPMLRAIEAMAVAMLLGWYVTGAFSVMIHYRLYPLNKPI